MHDDPCIISVRMSYGKYLSQMVTVATKFVNLQRYIQKLSFAICASKTLRSFDAISQWVIAKFNFVFKIL